MSPTLTSTALLTALCEELCASLDTLKDALLGAPEGCISRLSDCNRRADALAADLQHRLSTAFCPTLPRVPTALLCSRLQETVGAVFEAVLLPLPHPRAGMRYASLFRSFERMADLLREGIADLPTGRGQAAGIPDPGRFAAERSTARAAYALAVSHGEGTPADIHAAAGMRRILHALDEVQTALVLLCLEIG